jgi:hypothetical protein
MESKNNQSTHNDDQDKIISAIIDTAEEKLDEAGKESATRAFNAGCTTGLIPGIIIVVIAYFLTKTWLAAIITGILMGMALVGYANLVALIARSKAMDRVYKSDIQPGIDQSLQEAEISQDEFNQFCLENLPETANLYQYLPKHGTAAENRKSRFSNLSKWMKSR